VEEEERGDEKEEEKEEKEEQEHQGPLLLPHILFVIISWKHISFPLSSSKSVFDRFMSLVNSRAVPLFGGKWGQREYGGGGVAQSKAEQTDSEIIAMELRLQV
jgi:hypothetical protein